MARPDAVGALIGARAGSTWQGPSLGLLSGLSGRGLKGFSRSGRPPGDRGEAYQPGPTDVAGGGSRLASQASTQRSSSSWPSSTPSSDSDVIPCVNVTTSVTS